MREPLHRFGPNNRVYGSNGKGGGNQRDRDNYCWKFNKNKCKFGARCRFEHCRHYCDGMGHGSFNCAKKTETAAQKINLSKIMQRSLKTGKQKSINVTQCDFEQSVNRKEIIN